MANNEKKHPTKMHESMWATFEECYETSVKKNADYCGSKNPFGNFMLSQMVGVPVERGILVRIMDKISRVNTLLDKKPEVAGESIRDSLLDLVNYAAILLAYLESKKKK